MISRPDGDRSSRRETRGLQDTEGENIARERRRSREEGGDRSITWAAARPMLLTKYTYVYRRSKSSESLARLTSSSSPPHPGSGEIKNTPDPRRGGSQCRIIAVSICPTFAPPSQPPCCLKNAEAQASAVTCDPKNSRLVHVRSSGMFVFRLRFVAFLL